MFDFHEKRKLRGVVFSWFSVGVVLTLVAVLSFSVYERFIAERKMAEKRADTETELEELKLRAATLETQVEHLMDDRGIEEEIRKRFDAVKEGEQVVILVDDDRSAEVDISFDDEVVDPDADRWSWLPWR